MEADQVILVDAVRGGGRPGDVYRFPWEAKPEHIHYKDSLHQIDMMETLALLPLVGEPPQVVVVGVEFEDIFDYGLELTPKVERAVEKLIEVVVGELRELGAEPTLKDQPDKVLDVFSGTG
jgi:hydrogenase maturation protease